MKRLVGIILGALICVIIASVYVFNNYQYMEEFQDLNTGSESGSTTTTSTETNYEELTTKLENEELRLDLLLEYTLQGTIYEIYTMTDSEVDSVVASGKITLDGAEYTVKAIDSENDMYMFGPAPEYGAYAVNDVTSKEELRYTIGKENGKYVVTRQSDYSTVWKETNKKASVTIDKNTTCEESYTGEESIASDVFENYIPVDNHGYTFDFENGKCVKVYLPHNY